MVLVLISILVMPGSKPSSWAAWMDDVSGRKSMKSLMISGTMVVSFSPGMSITRRPF